MEHLPDVTPLAERATRIRKIWGCQRRIKAFLALANELVAVYINAIGSPEKAAKLFASDTIDAHQLDNDYVCFRIRRWHHEGQYWAGPFNVNINLSDAGGVSIGNCEVNNPGWHNSTYMGAFCHLNGVLSALAGATVDAVLVEANDRETAQATR